MHIPIEKYPSKTNPTVLLIVSVPILPNKGLIAYLFPD